EFYMNYRSLHWNQALDLAEAGVEDALFVLNFRYIKGQGFKTADGWNHLGGLYLPLLTLPITDTGYTKTVTGFTNTSGTIVGNYTVQVINPTAAAPYIFCKATVTNNPYGKAVSRLFKV